MVEHIFPTLCTACGAEMIEDDWELVDILPNGQIEIDTIYPAWVCSEMCGFYVEIRIILTVIANGICETPVVERPR